MNRCKLALGNNRFVQVVEWKGELRVDLRQWENNYPSKKGVSLNLMQYKNLLAALDLTITPAFTNDQKELQFKAAKNGSHHLGANVFVSARQDNPCVDIDNIGNLQTTQPSYQPREDSAYDPRNSRRFRVTSRTLRSSYQNWKTWFPATCATTTPISLEWWAVKTVTRTNFTSGELHLHFFFHLLRCKNCITDVFILILATCYKWTGKCSQRRRFFCFKNVVIV